MVEITLRDGSVYIGQLFTFQTFPQGSFAIGLKKIICKKGTPRGDYKEKGCMIVQGSDIDDLVVLSTRLFGATASSLQNANTTMNIDGEITTGASGYGRKLQSAEAWLTSGNVSGNMDENEEGNGKKWDQFAVNAEKFGVANTYDENLYTTKLDKSKMSAKQIRDADMLAKEIERMTSSNVHMNEERGRAVSDGRDEEARYSSVMRRDSSKSASSYKSGKGKSERVPLKLTGRGSLTKNKAGDKKEEQGKTALTGRWAPKLATTVDKAAATPTPTPATPTPIPTVPTATPTVIETTAAATKPALKTSAAATKATSIPTGPKAVDYISPPESKMSYRAAVGIPPLIMVRFFFKKNCNFFINESCSLLKTHPYRLVLPQLSLLKKLR